MLCELGIPGAWLCIPTILPDQRGSFVEWFRGAELAALGYSFTLAQANLSSSHKGVVRGIHFAEVPPGQAKYVACVSGAILDVVVDVRVGSPTFGRWLGVQLDEERRQALYLAEGLGHAFQAISSDATVVYLSSQPHRPEVEHRVHPLDPEIGIEWPILSDLRLSLEDAQAPSLRDAQSSRLLPNYRRT